MGPHQDVFKMTYLVVRWKRFCSCGTQMVGDLGKSIIQFYQGSVTTVAR